jgi:hypothetical protein
MLIRVKLMDACAGRYGNALSLAVCLACDSVCPFCNRPHATRSEVLDFAVLQGTFANVTGLDKCIPCAKGRFSARNTSLASGDGPSTCLPCAAGRFCDTLGQPACTPCGPGESQPTGGQSTCVACA